MARYYEESGYSRGGLDVETGVNLFFKGIILFPVFVLCSFVGLTMIKHVLFNGIPVMNGPSEEQVEQIRERDENISAGEGWNVPVPSLPSPNEAYNSMSPEEARNYTSQTLPSWNTEILESPFE